MFKKILLLSTVGVVFFSCKKDEVASPDETTSGGETTTTTTRDLKPTLELRFDGNLDDNSAENNTVEGVGLSYAKDRHGDTNRAVYIDLRSSSKLHVKNAPALDFGTGPNKKFTLSFWFKFNTINPIAKSFSIITKADQNWRGSNDFDYGVSFSTTQGLIPFTGPSSDKVNYPLNVVSSADTSWHHFVMTCDQTDTTTGKKVVYWDGKQVFTGTYATKGASRDYNLVFGRGKSGVSPFDGFYDDFLIYKETLTATEVKNLFDKNSIK